MEALTFSGNGSPSDPIFKNSIDSLATEKNARTIDLNVSLTDFIQHIHFP